MNTFTRQIKWLYVYLFYLLYNWWEISTKYKQYYMRPFQFEAVSSQHEVAVDVGDLQDPDTLLYSQIGASDVWCPLHNNALPLQESSAYLVVDLMARDIWLGRMEKSVLITVVLLGQHRHQDSKTIKLYHELSKNILCPHKEKSLLASSGMWLKKTNIGLRLSVIRSDPIYILKVPFSCIKTWKGH